MEYTSQIETKVGKRKILLCAEDGKNYYNKWWQVILNSQNIIDDKCDTSQLLYWHGGYITNKLKQKKKNEANFSIE